MVEENGLDPPPGIRLCAVSACCILEAAVIASFGWVRIRGPKSLGFS